ncbi:MAG: low molecular weight phosphotyrosine protein phosphatase [Clostridia bacterium]|nr:low molecular weight phosphotyrosine protein phosphatase [Clostridia bacterium]
MKIMFVCHGNICRSPMAEFIMRDLISKQPKAAYISVSSSATSREEIWNGIGNPVYPPAAAELRKHGIDCAGKRARQVTAADYEKYDLFVVMDDNNLRNILRIFGSDPENKVVKLMDYTQHSRDVADPWYTGDFSKAYKDIYDGCTALLEKLTEN